MYFRFRWRRSAPLILTIALLTCSVQAQTDNSFCWKGSFSRGVGGLKNACPQGTDFEVAACYTTCGPGWENTPAALLCEATCPAGWTDLPGTCDKPSDITSAGYGWQTGDSVAPGHYLDGARARCEAANQSVGCYLPQNTLIYYPNCPANYEHNGPSICTAVCPSNMHDSGTFCNKPTPQGRTMSVPSCGSGMDTDGALCYPSCGSGYDGVGPICWSQCPPDHSFQCGAACATSEAACQAAVGNMVFSTIGAAVDVASMALGGPGLSSALREAMEAGTTGMADAVLTHVPESGESLLFNATKDYALSFGKQFVKATLKNGDDPRNMFWSALKKSNAGLKEINKASTEFGVEQNTGVMNLDDLTLLDPTGLSSLVLAFTKYGSCDGSDFSVDHNGELNFGAINGSATQTITLLAQRPLTITRITSPALSNCSITSQADCIGKKLLPSQSCPIQVTVNSKVNMDSELRIYTDDYTAVPYPIHILANPNVAAQATVTPNVDEAANLTMIAGVWAYNNNQSQKMVVQSNGQVSSWDGSGTVAAAGDAGRAFAFTNGRSGQTLTLSSTGDHLTSAPLAGPITVKSTGKVLDITGNSSANGALLEQWDNNGGLNQHFTFNQQPDGAYQIVASNSGKVLDVTGNSLADGTAIEQWVPNGGQNQEFRVEAVGDGSYYKIVSVLSGLALTVSNNSSSDGAGIIQSVWKDLPGQAFQLNTTSGNFIRRPWDPGCNPGEVLFDGLCYDVPPGKAMTTPGIMGNICPADWRDDGTACWPPWTGVVVATQADPNGSDDLRHPLVVTSCSNYSQQNGQSCPVNYSGPVGCSCQPITQSKNIASIQGHSSSN